MTYIKSNPSRSLKLLATALVASGFSLSAMSGSALAEKHNKVADDKLAIERGDKPATKPATVPDQNKFDSGRIGKKVSPEEFKRLQARTLEQRAARIKLSVAGRAEVKFKN